MKTLIFSDTHLTSRFDRKKFDYLKNLITSADRIIINGDFWDGLSVTFDQFVNSQWQQLFPLLKEKQTVYIYGNHDFAWMSDERVNLFSVRQVEELTLTTNSHKLIIKHGHQHTISIQGALKHPRILKFTNGLFEIVEGLAVKLMGKSLLALGPYRMFTQSMQQYAHLNLNQNEVLVCGHSHNALFLPEQKYVNSGIIRHGLAQYLLIENNELSFKEERY